MSRSLNDINAKLAYLTNRSARPPALKTKKPLVMNNKQPGMKLQKAVNPCKKELSDLLECISQYNDNSKCATQFASLLKCSETDKTVTKEKMDRLLKGEKVDSHYHPKVLQNLLQRFPEHTSKKGLDTQRNLLTTLPEKRIQSVPYEDKGRPFKKLI